MGVRRSPTVTSVPLLCEVKMARRIRQVWDAIGDQMRSFFTPQPGVCVQCHGPLGHEIHCRVLPKENIELEFCSQYCAYNYWEEFKRYCRKTAGKTVRTLAIVRHTLTAVPHRAQCV